MKKLFAIIPLLFITTKSFALFSGYTYQRQFTILSSKVPNTDQTNFPVLISTTDATLATTGNGGHISNASGYDLIFSTMNDCSFLLNWDTETYNASTGNVIVWVKHPLVTHVSSATIYMCYGNAAITSYQGNSQQTWSNSYAAVLHYDDNAANANAAGSSPNGNSGIYANNSSGNSTTGQISKGMGFNGSSDFMSFVATAPINMQTNTSPLTISVWVKTTQTDASIYGGRDIGSGRPILDLQIGNNGVDNTGTGKLSVIIWDVSGAATFALVDDTVVINDGGWHYVSYTRNSSQLNTIFRDGQSAGTVTDSATTPISVLIPLIGSERQNAGIPSFSGTMDEVRVSTVARSSDWIATEFNNQGSISTFMTMGAESTGTTTPTPQAVIGIQGGKFTVRGGKVIIL